MRQTDRKADRRKDINLKNPSFQAMVLLNMFSVKVI